MHVTKSHDKVESASSSQTIRIVIVDDHPMFREGVSHSLSNDPCIAVVGEGSNADDALRLAKDTLPDILLLDISMPGSGLNAAALVKESCPKVRIAMLTVSENDDDLMRALKAGADGYVLKGVSSSELVAIVKDLHRGQMYVSPGLAARVLADFHYTANHQHNRHSTSSGSPADLTAREEQILKLIAKGMSNREIGSVLNIAEKTVKNYVTNVFQKLQVKNRVEAALVASQYDNPK